MISMRSRRIIDEKVLSSNGVTSPKLTDPIRTALALRALGINTTSNGRVAIGSEEAFSQSVEKFQKVAADSRYPELTRRQALDAARRTRRVAAARGIPIDSMRD